MISIRRQSHRPDDGARVGARPVYAIGDVHGCYGLLKALLQEISRDAEDREAGAVPMVILLGDYVDRGPESAKVLSALTWLRRSSAVDLRLLEGNHEAMLRLFLDDPVQHAAWLRFGGRETLQSYGVAMQDEDAASPAALAVLRDALLDVMPAAHLALLQGLPPYIEIGSYVFVHAGIRPGVAMAEQSRDDMLWIRDGFLDEEADTPPVVVHGHSWDDVLPGIGPYRIGIDTGAYETGVLSAVRITDSAIEVIQAVEAT